MARRRSFGRRVSRRRGPVSWVNGVHSETVINIDGSLSELELMTGGDWGGDPSTTGTRKMGHLLRTVGSFAFMPIFDTSASAQARETMAWAVYIIDNEDTDSDLMISGGSAAILSTCRVLATGVIGWHSFEPATIGDATAGVSWPAQLVQFDTKVRAKLGPDDALVLGCQMFSASTQTWASMTTSGIARMLIREP